LHKQAISGDAPENLACQTAAERAKFQAWRGKSGVRMEEAMQLYLQEADRQIRVYGISGTSSLPQTPQSTPAIDGGNDSSFASASQPRGLAAIPLLCAAASESRQAYLRRLAQTTTPNSWWSRQEALCAVPHTFGALPETMLLKTAALVEYVSLSCDGVIPLPAAVMQSFLWPFHNVLLCVWMGLIVVLTAFTAAWDILQTLIWGSRRTGLSLSGIWNDQVVWSAQSVNVLTESHQPLTARVVGLLVLPYTVLVTLSRMPPSELVASVAYAALLGFTWWYWVIVLPWMTWMLLCAATVSGSCFALIELAGV